MTLKEEGLLIDAALQEQCDKWVEEIRAAESRILALEEVIKVAAAFGDLSENTEYTDAVNTKQQLLKSKVELEEKVRSYKMRFETYATQEFSRGELICVGSVVRVVYEELHKTMIVKIVPRKSDAPQKHAISDTSPLGRALLNKRVGDSTIVTTERKKWVCRVEEVY